MMASHGCGGQRIGFGRFLGLAALVAAGWGGVPEAARACHIHHHPRAATDHSVGAETVSPPGSGSIVHSQQILNPTSLLPQIPPLTPTSAPLITTTAATAPAPAPTAPAASTPLTPSPLTNPPAAELVVPPAPTATSAWHDAGTPTCSCSCPLTPPTNVPVVATSPAGQGLNPPAASILPAATTTPEPATLVSALVMIGAAAAWRRRGL